MLLLEAVLVLRRAAPSPADMSTSLKVVSSAAICLASTSAQRDASARRDSSARVLRAAGARRGAEGGGRLRSARGTRPSRLRLRLSASPLVTCRAADPATCDRRASALPRLRRTEGSAADFARPSGRRFRRLGCGFGFAPSRRLPLSRSARQRLPSTAPITSPTSTVSPACFRICSSTPAPARARRAWPSPIRARPAARRLRRVALATCYHWPTGNLR